MLSTRATVVALCIMMVRCYDVVMRTTVNVDDDVLAGARSLAREREISLGAALSELARRGLRARPVDTGRTIPGFIVDAGSPAITPEMVRAANEDA